MHLRNKYLEALGIPDFLYSKIELNKFPEQTIKLLIIEVGAQDSFCSQGDSQNLLMKMLESIKCDLRGKDCVIIGASNIVGRPMAMELLNAGATVQVCHKGTKNITEKTKSADIIIAAAGVANLVKGNWVKEGAVVIDVGINRLADGTLVGDVHFDEVKNVASAISPVPGGVGPMTIAVLLENTLIAYQAKL